MVLFYLVLSFSFFDDADVLFIPKNDSDKFNGKFNVLWLCGIIFGVGSEDENAVEELGPNKSNILALLIWLWLLWNPTWVCKYGWEFVRLNFETATGREEAITGGNSMAWSKYESFICTCTNHTPLDTLPGGEARGSQSLNGLWERKRECVCVRGKKGGASLCVRGK